VMLVPLAVLAFGAVFSGMIFYKPFFGSDESVGKYFGVLEASEYEEHAAGFTLITPAYAAGEDTGDHGEEGAHGAAAWPAEPGTGAIFKHPDNHVLHEAHLVPKWVKVSPFIAMLLGFGLAYQMYIRRPDWPARLAENQSHLYNFLLNKWYFDEVYDVIFVRPAKWLGSFFWKRGDMGTIDGGINGLAMGVIPFLTRLAGRAQNGYIFSYAFAMVLGIAVLLMWMMLSGGAN